MADKETKADKKNFTYISDKQTIVYTKNENEVKIGFKLTRKKNSIIYKEFLEIDAFIFHSFAYNKKNEIRGYNKAETMGSISVSIVNLQEELLGLREYGVVLPRFVYGQLKNEIEKIYMTLKVEAVDEYKEVLVLLKEYIAEQPLVNEEHPYLHKDKAEDCYCIPVTTFSNLLKESEFAQEETAIRRYLKESGYTICNTGRYDRTISMGTKKEKVICIIKNKLDAVETDSET